MSMSVHNAGSGVRVTATFRNEAGELDTPNLAPEYCVVDQKSGDLIVDWTYIQGPLSEVMTFDIPAESNMMISDHAVDRRRVTVRFIFGEEDLTGTGEYFYLVKNLKSLTPGSP